MFNVKNYNKNFSFLSLLAPLQEPERSPAGQSRTDFPFLTPFKLHKQLYLENLQEPQPHITKSKKRKRSTFQREDKLLLYHNNNKETRLESSLRVIYYYGY